MPIDLRVGETFENPFDVGIINRSQLKRRRGQLQRPMLHRAAHLARRYEAVLRRFVYGCASAPVDGRGRFSPSCNAIKLAAAAATPIPEATGSGSPKPMGAFMR